MDLCKHTGWLRLSTKDRAYVLEISDRAQRLLDSLPRPDNQFPGVIHLIGNETKRLAMKRLGVEIARPNTSRGHGEIHLSLSADTVASDRPVVVADSDIPLHNRLGRPRKPPLCHEITARPLLQPLKNASSSKVECIADRAYTRMLLPFADVICFFAGDVGGLPRVAHRLAAWLDLGKQSTSAVCPWLVIIVESGEENVARQTLLKSLRTMTSIDVLTLFQGIRVVSLAGLAPKTALRRGCPSARWDTFRNELLYMVETKRVERLQASCLFSATHLAAFLRHAAERLGDVTSPPLDFLGAARIENPVAGDLEHHLANFLREFRSLESLRAFAVPVIASTFLLDQYPPGMHHFDPRDVFQSLYRDACYNICGAVVLAHEGSTEMVLPSQFVKLIETEMTRRFRRLKVGESAASVHRHLLAQFGDEWARFQSEKTCYHCLSRRPQVFPPCGHGWCRNCVSVFGTPSPDNEWAVEIDGCLLCRKEWRMLFQLKPDTATVRVLCLDGGGTRGKYPLKLLKQLQDRINLPNFPVQQHFDIVYGTSSGKSYYISAGALCLNGWTIEECIASFESLASQAFTPRHLPAVPVVRPLLELVMCLPLVPTFVRLAALVLLDSRYPSRHIEKALRSVFGLDKSIVDYSAANAMGTMVGMTTATIQDASACVFTNYNGVGVRDDNRGLDQVPSPIRPCYSSDDLGMADYRVLMPENGARNIPIWEIYFTPWHIRGVGKLQDGGLVANNPSSIALQEAAALYPNAPDPSILVSLGTGSSAQCNESHVSESRWPWRDCFPIRLFRALWNLGSTRRTWQQVITHKKVGHAGEFFCFDVEFAGEEPPLDDLSCLEDDDENDRGTIIGLPELERLVLCMRAELFVFELCPVRPFRFVNGEYECLGYIRCRLEAGSDTLHEFMSQLGQSFASFRVGDRALAGGFPKHPLLDDDGKFCKEVRFRVASREQPVGISLWESSREGCSISGSPFNLQRLVREQKLDASFGTADHRKRRREGKEEASGRHKRQRR
ncbi:uncharacterized protein CTRU02_215510 [Colletotrichum truncatum]|uniref:Uncharacterized protein n=1 Tax=Colletotrichum truncatum TaxID=5467 RepID=A0ACC3YCT9_COLTU